MSESDAYLAALYVEDRCGDRVWVTEQVCHDRPSGTRWMETELNARRQAAALGAQEGWHYVATFGEFPPPPMTTASLRGPDTTHRVGPFRRGTPNLRRQVSGAHRGTHSQRADR